MLRVAYRQNFETDSSIACAIHGVFTGELNEEDLLANDNSIIVVTRAGYIKRMPLADFQVGAALILLTQLHTDLGHVPHISLSANRL
jgi:DNA gyrase/topoisomerase IV subunit A